MTDYFVNINGGRGTQDGTTFANACSALTQLTSAPAAGSRIKLQSIASVTQANTIQCTNQSLTATLGSAQTLTIYGDGAWTGNTNVTGTSSTTRKEGSNSGSLAIASAFTTGSAGYFATGTLNCSTYQKISFWINTSIVVAANTLQIQLCSDTIGAVAVNSFTIPYATIANTWHLFTLDFGGALGAVINSVGVNCLLDPGTVTVLIDDIIACTATGLNMSQLFIIGNYAYGFKSINGTSVVFDQGPSSVQAAGRGFWHPNGTATYNLVTQEVIPLGATQTLSTTNASMLISGGWDSTAMTTQSGQTWFDDLSGVYNCLTLAAKAASTEYIGGARCGSNAMLYSATTVTSAVNVDLTNTDSNGTAVLGGTGNFLAVNGIASNCYFGNFVSNSNLGFPLSVVNVTYNNCVVYSAGSGFITSAGFNSYGVFLNGCMGANNTGTPFTLSTGTIWSIKNCESYYNAANGFSLGSPGIFFNLTASGNAAVNFDCLSAGCGGLVRVVNATGATATTADIRLQSGVSGDVVFINPTLSSTTKISALGPGRIITQKENGVLGSNNQYNVYGTVLTDSASALSGQAWKFSPTSLIPTAAMPLRLCIGTFEMLANKTLTVSVQAARTSANINGTLRIFGGITPGIPTDVTVALTPTAVSNPGPSSGYSSFSLPSVTPTETCVVEVWAEVYSSSGLSNSFWVDSVTATST